jgi:predicted nucleic acid-binding protein
VRAVIDTNVVLSGLLWPGKPHRLIEQVRAGALTFLSSPALLAELAEVVARPKFKSALAQPKPRRSGATAGAAARWMAAITSPEFADRVFAP